MALVGVGNNQLWASGTSALLSTFVRAASGFVAPLLVPMLNSVVAQMQAKEQPPQLVSMLSLFLLVWLVVIFVRIVRAAFEWPWPAALLLVIGQEIFSVLVFVLVFGGPATPG